MIEKKINKDFFWILIMDVFEVWKCWENLYMLVEL